MYSYILSIHNLVHLNQELQNTKEEKHDYISTFYVYVLVILHLYCY